MSQGMTQSFELIEASREHISLIAEFQMAMALETEGFRLDPIKCLAGVGGVFEVPHRGTYFLAMVDSKIVGSVLIQKEWSDWRCGEVWWIHSLYVIPDARGQKIFSKMYEVLKQLGQKSPLFRGFRLFVEKANARAQSAYRAVGMTDEHYKLFEWMTEF